MSSIQTASKKLSSYQHKITKQTGFQAQVLKFQKRFLIPLLLSHTYVYLMLSNTQFRPWASKKRDTDVNLQNLILS